MHKNDKVTINAETGEIVLNMSLMDIRAGLSQSARIARNEGFAHVAQRCEEYAEAINRAMQLRADIWCAQRDSDITFPFGFNDVNITIRTNGY